MKPSLGDMMVVSVAVMDHGTDLELAAEPDSAASVRHGLPTDWIAQAPDAVTTVVPTCLCRR